jgi:hypothetical protein
MKSNDGAVRTQFLSLTFDPWAAAGSADEDASGTGITRLVFSRESKRVRRGGKSRAKR